MTALKSRLDCKVVAQQRLSGVIGRDYSAAACAQHLLLLVLLRTAGKTCEECFQEEELIALLSEE